MAVAMASYFFLLLVALDVPFGGFAGMIALFRVSAHYL